MIKFISVPFIGIIDIMKHYTVFVLQVCHFILHIALNYVPHAPIFKEPFGEFKKYFFELYYLLCVFFL